MPFLAKLGLMADGLAADLQTQFSAEIASVYLQRDNGFQVVAHRGLSQAEAGIVVAETQPIFSDVMMNGEGILVQPVKLAAPLVAGIGGARTEALMVVPAAVENQLIAMLVVGGFRFDENDLNRLGDLATEAAPGIAVARLLERLGGQA
jgi:transcriptional regulator with GAF, ATPase, and Fis domain